MNLESFFSSKLNPTQLEAVKNTDGPSLILAGAGSGKTRVLTYRLANIVAQGKARPDEILAVTFTNKAAAEMSHRAENILKDMGIHIIEKLWVSTFHATCVRILRDHISLLGYKRSFAIYDSSDQISVLKKIVKSLGLQEKEHPAKSFQYRIRWAKNDGLLPSDIQNSKKYHMDKRSLEVYRLYEEELFRSSALDFDDLLLKTHQLFQEFPKVLEAYQRRFRYIMVDEYQDTNQIQYQLVKLLASQHKNLCVVGDEDQSIYSWRGADISNILNFEADYDKAFVVKLEENYRSTKTIVEAASSVIANNTQRKGKKLFSNKELGDPILIREEDDDREEASFVVRQIKKISKESAYKDIAVFYRNNAQSRVLEEQLRLSSIPYKLIGGLRFYDRMEIKDALSYLRLILNPTDDVAFKRIINVPARGIGKSTIEKLESISIDHKFSMVEASNFAIQEKLVNSGAVKKLSSFLSLIANLQLSIENLLPSESLNLVLEETQYIKKFELEDTPEAVARIENLQELSNALVQYEQDKKEKASLVEFLEEMALMSDQDGINHQEDCVHLMTLHVSKGLEFPYVFIVGMEEGIFPSGQAIESQDTTEIEEERRLAYVGFTRAMKHLYLLHARRRRMWGQTQFNAGSRFLDELPTQYTSSTTSSLRPQFSNSFSSKSPWEEEDDFSQDMPDYDEVSYSIQEPKKSNFYEGARVRHPLFGPGTIREVKGTGDNAKLKVEFDSSSTKSLIAKHSKLDRI